MNRFKAYKKTFNLKKLYMLIIIFIIIFTIYFIFFINKRVTPKIKIIVSDKLEEIIINIVNESFSKEVLGYIKPDDIIIINKNKSDEIISTDFNLENAYKILRKATKNLQSKLNDLEDGKYYFKEDVEEYYLDAYSKNGFIFKVPIGLYTDSIFLSSFGSKIPIRIEFVGSVLSSIKTNVKAYGINNSLIEVYAVISLSNKLILPITNEKKVINSKVLIASAIIEGKVPSFYNGNMTKNSSILSSTIK